MGVHCCSYHTSGSVIAVGCVDGRWYVLDANTRDVVHSHRDGNDCINCMAYSPGMCCTSDNRQHDSVLLNAVLCHLMTKAYLCCMLKRA